ncbi:hypothetical protein ACWC5F_30415 [Streptomyces sp. NPDC001272]
MSMSEMGGESIGGESGREPAERSGEPAPRRRPTAARRVAAWAVKEFSAEAVEAVVSAWAPEWAETAGVLITAVRLAVHLRQGGGGRPRG